KEITIDPLVMEFLDYFHSDEQFLRFLVPETDQENYYCDSYYYTRRNYLKRARTNQNGPGGFIQFLRWDIEVSREELLNQFIPILYGLLDQRMMHLDKGIICPLWRIRTITRSKNSSSDATIPSVSYRNTYLSDDQIDTIVEYLLNNQALTYLNVPPGSEVTIEIRFEFRNREFVSRNEYSLPELILMMSTGSHNGTFEVRLHELDMPYRDNLLAEIFNNALQTYRNYSV